MIEYIIGNNVLCKLKYNVNFYLIDYDICIMRNLYLELKRPIKIDNLKIKYFLYVELL